LGFKFEIGEIVKHRLMVKNEYHPEKKSVGTPLLIVERVACECSGGVQLIYNCRLGTTSNSNISTFHPEKTFSLHEVELEKMGEGEKVNV
jgi:hypothetical protein